jgi:hypothetical protein
MHLIATDAALLPEDDDRLSLRNFAHFFYIETLVHLAGKYPIAINKSLVETFSKVPRGMATVWQRVCRTQGPTSAERAHEPIAASHLLCVCVWVL